MSKFHFLVNAISPDNYIRDGFQKIQMYKRVKAIESEEDYTELVDEMIDRFGDLPLRGGSSTSYLTN